MNNNIHFKHGIEYAFLDSLMNSSSIMNNSRNISHENNNFFQLFSQLSSYNFNNYQLNYSSLLINQNSIKFLSTILTSVRYILLFFLLLLIISSFYSPLKHFHQQLCVI